MSDSRPLFHISVHVRPSGVGVPRAVTVDECEVTALGIRSADLQSPFRVSFEQVSASLADLPRMFIEPDGSLVWVSSPGIVPPWQVDGALYDRRERLLYVELKGSCSRDAFSRMLAACDDATSSSKFVVQLVRHAIVIDSEEFIRCFLRD